MADMTPEQRKLARHALGLPSKTNRSYRNYFDALTEIKKLGGE